MKTISNEQKSLSQTEWRSANARVYLTNIESEKNSTKKKFMTLIFTGVIVVDVSKAKIEILMKILSTQKKSRNRAV